MAVGIFTFFTGAGFLDLGFETSGFLSLFANEISTEFCNIYKHSRNRLSLPLPKYGLHEKSIDNFLDAESDKNYLTDCMKDARTKCDLVGFIGGPPCPDFSVAGKNKGAKGNHGRLSTSYMDLICLNKPDFFVFENVKGLWRTGTHREFFDSLVNQANKSGYLTSARLINALEYGAPQDRDRIILIGVLRSKIKTRLSKKDCEIHNFPWSDFIKYNLSEIKHIDWPHVDPFQENQKRKIPKGIIKELTVEYWFNKNDVTNHPNAEDYFIPRAGLEKMKLYSEGDDSKKCYKRLHRWRYSPTAAYGNNEVHLHPYKARRISVAESLAIQSLPKNFELPADISLTAKFKTIGNGVPFLAAQGVANTLKHYLDLNCRG